MEEWEGWEEWEWRFLVISNFPRKWTRRGGDEEENEHEDEED